MRPQEDLIGKIAAQFFPQPKPRSDQEILLQKLRQQERQAWDTVQSAERATAAVHATKISALRIYGELKVERELLEISLGLRDSEGLLESDEHELGGP